VRVGYVLPNSWGIEQLADVTALAVEAEASGADSLWVSHHVLHVGFVRERLGTLPYHDPLVTLTVVAAATTRARLGVSVLVIPYLHPMPTAKTLATIDCASGGRLVLGVGVGGLRVEHDAIGQVPFARRGRYADEFLDVLHVLWSGTPSSYAGEFFAFEDVQQFPLPVRPGGLPIFVGGGSDAAVRRAVRHGEGFHAIGLDPDDCARLRARLDAALDRLGPADRAHRTHDGFELQVRLHVAADDRDPTGWKRRIDEYAGAGVDEVLLAPQSTDLAEHRRWIGDVLPGVTAPG
jgi:probable F420-dependent oxidoreductase